MENCCTENKKKVRTPEEKHAFTTRINRITGQMNGIKRMIDEDRYCTEILVQLSAIEQAVRSLSRVILEEHMHSCMVENIQNGDLASVDEVAELIKRFF